MALIIDVREDPTEDRCFFQFMRELRDRLDTSLLNSSATDGHPYFRTENDEMHKTLLASQKNNKGKLGAMKIETGILSVGMDGWMDG